MPRPSARRFLIALPAAFATGALWGAAGAVLEAALFNRWYHAQLRPLANTVELMLNYAVYAGVAIVVLRLVIGAVGGVSGRAAASRRRRPEALVGAGVPVVILANFLQVGPLGPYPVRSLPIAALALGALGGIALLCWGLRRMPLPGLRALRVALAVWVGAGLAWEPLFGPYGGALRGEGRKAAAGSHPNVLLIVTDTLRRDFLDCYGATWHASPAADRLAEEGALFMNQIAQSTWTLPSTGSLLTGQFPSSHGSVAKELRLAGTSPFLPELLEASGFHTGAFTENSYILPRMGYGRGFDRFYAVWLPWVFDFTVVQRAADRLGLPVIRFTEKEPYPERITRPDQVHWDARPTTDEALEWLGSLDDSPFFAYVHYMGPHGPYGPPQYLLDRPSPAVPVIDHPREMGGGFPLGGPGAPVAPEDIETMKTLYAADNLYVETQIVRMLDWLMETGKMEGTIVVFTSDHGEEFYEHEAWNHGGAAFDETLRAPLIISSPGRVKRGVRIEDYTRHIDVMPTILDLVGLECPAQVQGRSLRPLLEGEQLDPLPVYVEVYPPRPPGYSIFSLVREQHKVIRVATGDESTAMLFDLQADPEEKHDLSETRPELYDALLREMEVWDGVARMFATDADAVPLDPRTLQRLRSLGYVN